MTGRDYLRALVLRDRNKTAATTALPQRRAGAAHAAATPTETATPGGTTAANGWDCGCIPRYSRCYCAKQETT